jgi:hypothetical protein
MEGGGWSSSTFVIHGAVPAAVVISNTVLNLLTYCMTLCQLSSLTSDRCAVIAEWSKLRVLWAANPV